jgi:hypothetical protein
MRVLLVLLAVTGFALATVPFDVAHVDRTLSGTSQYPVAIDRDRIGKYLGKAKSGAGYFYDDVLEYRVWLHPERGAAPLAGDNDYFAAFAQYENAAAYSHKTPGAEEPLVLVRQRESIDEPKPGQYVWVKTERITEWQVGWLQGSKRAPTSIEEFLAHPRPANHEPAA